MGFDKHFHEDHCYMDDSMNNVGMNVEIIEDASQPSVSAPAPNRNINGTVNEYLGEAMKVDGLDNDLYLYTDCGTEHSALFLLEDEKLVKPGDRFESHDIFVQYLNENAKRWNYYYSCSDSRKPNTENESYIYNCVYLKNKEKYKKKGLRKRNNTMKTDCPCKIKLRHLPNEKELTVVYVCNHHDHELSPEQFRKLQHGRRLPPYVKEEILDFLALQVDKGKIRNYVEMETGFKMSRPFFYTLERNMQKTGNITRVITEERLKMLNEKLTVVDEMYRYNNEEQNEQQTKAMQAVRSLQKLAKCEIQKNPWVPDQCVPILPNRTDKKFQESQSEMQGQESETIHLNIEYGEPGDNIQVINRFNNGNEVDDHNDIDNIAYETVVTEDGNHELSDQTQDYVSIDSEIIDDDEIAMDNSHLREHVVGHLESRNDQDTIEVQYTIEQNENLIDYTDSEETQHDVGVQTNLNIDTGQTVLPVFDVYMKDGNVMGFVVNDNAINGLKDRVDKGIQTSEDIIYSDTQEIENEDCEILDNSNEQTGDTYTKHEYVHRYNIEQYMTQPHFPKYVEILAKETHMDVLNMFTNIYNEKAMFKITTTQKGNEGNTRIRYITHNGKIKKKKADDAKREKFGKNLQSIFILKEKMRMLKKKNEELMNRNEYLQDVALKLVNREV
ncbi:unnamed protein product [Arctia plantaginis]|uniref:FAR1 domain-containing protein n=1 Tax=Arctia plantaginis TaxID=874455 RepID=A0A8S1B6B5_ARCPL|nr:unnamed protein product [Arctia plantaginis]